MSVNGACFRRPSWTAGYGGVRAEAPRHGNSAEHEQSRLKDLIAFDLAQQKVRRAGAGRPSLTPTDPKLLENLERLLEPATSATPCGCSWGHPRAVRSSQQRCTAWGIKFGEPYPPTARTLNYRRQVNRKTKEGSHHPDRDAQFEHINKQVMALPNRLARPGFLSISRRKSSSATTRTGQ